MCFFRCNLRRPRRSVFLPCRHRRLLTLDLDRVFGKERYVMRTTKKRIFVNGILETNADVIHAKLLTSKSIRERWHGRSFRYVGRTLRSLSSPGGGGRDAPYARSRDKTAPARSHLTPPSVASPRWVLHQSRSLVIAEKSLRASESPPGDS
jgi:hypothetical protein